MNVIPRICGELGTSEILDFRVLCTLYTSYLQWIGRFAMILSGISYIHFSSLESL